MGRPQSKEVKEEVIIAQNGAGNEAAASTAYTDHVNHVLLITLFVVIGTAILLLAYNYYKKCHNKWIDKKIENYTFQRLRARFSKRFSSNQGDGENEEV